MTVTAHRPGEQIDPFPFPSRKKQHDAAALALAAVSTLSLFSLLLLVSPAVREAAPEALAVFGLGTAGASGGEDARQAEPGPSVPEPSSPRRAASRARSDTASTATAEAVVAPVADEAAPVPSSQPGPEAGGVVAVAQDLAAASSEAVSVIAGAGGGGGAGAGAGEGTGTGASGTGTGAGRGQRRILTATWAPGMDFSRDHLLYPRAAREQRVEGTAWLYCFVTRRDRVKDCRLIGEEPQGYGFGEAALKGRSGMRIRLHDETGRQVHDEWVVVTKTFNLD